MSLELGDDAGTSLLHRALSAVPGEVIVLLDAEGATRWANPMVREVLGYTPEHYCEVATIGIVHTDDQREANRLWSAVLAEPGRPEHSEVRLLSRAGNWCWMDVVMVNHLDDPEVGMVVATFRDTSEVRLAERALIASEERFRALIHNCSEVIVICDRAGVPSYVSPACERILGRSAHEVVASKVFWSIHPDDRERAGSELSPAFTVDGAHAASVFRVRHADGSWRWIEAQCTNLLHNPHVGGVVCNVRDIDRRKRIEDALRSSEQRLLGVLQNSRDVVAVLDVHTQLVWVSPVVSEMLGYDDREIVGRSVLDFVHPDDLEPALSRVVETVEGHRDADPITVRVLNADGDWVDVEVAGTLLEGSSGDADGVILNIRDVRWRVDADQVLRASEERFRALVQESSDALVVIDRNGIIEWASPALVHLFGMDPDAVVGTTGVDYTHPDDVEALVEAFIPVFEQPGARTKANGRVRCADGSWRWVEHSVVNLSEDPRVGAMVLHMRDVTDELEARQALRESEERFRSLAQSSPTGIFQQDVEAGCIYVNQRWQEITGCAAADALGDGWIRIVHPEDVARLGLDGPDVQISSEPTSMEFRVLRPDGEQRWVSVNNVPLFTSEGHLRSCVGTMEDVTERKAAQRDTQRLTNIFEATQDVVGIIDRTANVLYMNRAARRYFGVAEEGGLDGMSVVEIFDPATVELLTETVVPTLLADGMWSGELTVPSADGVLSPMLVQLLVHTDESGHVEFFSGVMHDISERKQFESQLAHQATHDPLTGLPNRLLLLDRLAEALERGRRHNRGVAVLFLDLDRFKVVNDSLGHDLGDRLLVAIADRLRVALRPHDTVARFGGDEFVVLCEDLVTDDDVIAVAERVNRAVSGAFTVDGNEVFIGVSIGIAFPSEAGVEPADLIRDADAAMYRAKERGRARWEIFDHGMRDHAVRRLDLESSLRRALERRELRVLYQPIVGLESGRIRGVEALLRWEHPERGLLTPGDFIGVAEETGMIVPIGGWVLRHAVRQLQRWDAADIHDGLLSLSVNLSGRQLGHSGLVGELREVLGNAGIAPHRLQLEMTESVLMDDVEASEETLAALKSLGVRLAVDDFGTGYSSLSYLRRFPVDTVKVDQSFVDGLGTDPSDSAIVTAIVTLAETLGLSSVAEGIESAEHLAELRRLGCDEGQGFFLARPMSGEKLAALLASRPSW